MPEGVDYYDVERMIRDERSAIRSEIERAVREANQQLRTEFEEQLRELRREIERLGTGYA